MKKFFIRKKAHRHVAHDSSKDTRFSYFKEDREETSRDLGIPKLRLNIPYFFYVNGKKYSYIQARALFYCAWYKQMVVRTEAYSRLIKMRDEGMNIHCNLGVHLDYNSNIRI